MNIFRHFHTITKHRNLVMKGCFKVGLYRQGLLHDLSKYSPTEFFPGCKYYQGTMSPNNAERRDKGYSSAWLHHKGRNKHHYEYWIDYSGVKDKALAGMKMPVRYVVEMFVDRICAAKVYQGNAYTDSSALKYYEMGKNYYVIHEESMALLETLLQRLSNYGEEETFAYIKQELLKK
ncbi:MAG: DUF5662 family protein [Lachnospiraceae bacterium]